METEFKEVCVGGVLQVKSYKDKLVVEDVLTLRFVRERDGIEADLSLFFLVQQFGLKARSFVKLWAKSFPSMRGSYFRACLETVCLQGDSFLKLLKMLSEFKTEGR